MNPAERTMLASRAAAAVAITPTSLAKELDDARNKITAGLPVWPNSPKTISRSSPRRVKKFGARTWCACIAARLRSTSRTRSRY